MSDGNFDKLTVNYDAHFAGNIGIGTTSPGRALEVCAKDANTGIKITGIDSERSWLVAVGAEAGDGKFCIYNYGFREHHHGPGGHDIFGPEILGGHRLTIDTDGNVGIGTTSPDAKLQVQGGGAVINYVAISTNPPSGEGIGHINFPYPNETIGTIDPQHNLRLHSNQSILFHTGNSQSPQVTIYESLVGIGTTSPKCSLHVRAPGSFVGLFESPTKEAFLRLSTSEGEDNRVEITNRPGGRLTLWTARGGDVLNITKEGNVGIGTGSPLAKLEVNGDIKVTGDVLLLGADCAEDFYVAGLEEIEAGTVMVICEDGALQPSQKPYDKRVAGVISGAGDFRPGIVLDKQTHDTRTQRRPLALVGKVYCKVDASYSPIEVGDLLTTSPTPGHGMKADDPTKAFGTVIGKALRDLEIGQGLIPILVCLQ